MRVALRDGMIIDVRFRREHVIRSLDGKSWLPLPKNAGQIGGFEFTSVRTHCRLSWVKDPGNEKFKGAENYNLITEACVTRATIDEPDKVLGFKLALTKAMKEAGIIKQHRETIWSAFKNIWMPSKSEQIRRRLGVVVKSYGLTEEQRDSLMDALSKKAGAYA